MTKWADYVITQANFGPNRKITQMKQLTDNGTALSDEELVARDVVIHNISKGKSFVTAFNGISGLKKGDRIFVIGADNEFFLRIDKNQVPADFLGPVSELS